jgi:SAM-dependent methyltransferase
LPVEGGPATIDVTGHRVRRAITTGSTDVGERQHRHGPEPDEHAFDEDYWQRHWKARDGAALPPNPYVVRETAHLAAGTAVDAGCGEGGEALWLAGQGWRVTGVDISAEALAEAGRRTPPTGLAGRVTWVEADLTSWQPTGRFDLVVTSYAHPAMPQLAFYERISGWVAPGGTLLVVGHRHDTGGHGHHPEQATATLPGITARLDEATWELVTAEEAERTLAGPDGHNVTLLDVVVRARRR